MRVMAKKDSGPSGLRLSAFKALVLSVLVLIAIACTAGHRPLGTEVAAASLDEALTPAQQTQFDPELKVFDSLLATEVEPKEGIVFSGSSSIRKWESLTSDMAPLPVANRGFGGAIIKQVTHYSSKMIVPLRPKLIVFYCGENDIANDKYPAEMALNDFKAFTASMRQKLPGTGIIFISMKPSPLRWKYWPKFQAANRLIESYVQTQDRMWYLDVSKAMLGPQGLPRQELFLSDSLHMNPAGYELWTRILKPEIGQRFEELSQN